MSDGLWGLIGVAVGAVATLVSTSLQQWRAAKHANETLVRQGVLAVVAERRAAATKARREAGLAQGRLQSDKAVLQAISEVQSSREAGELAPPKALEPPEIYEVTYLFFGEANVDLQRYWRVFHVYESAYGRAGEADQSLERAKTEQAALFDLAKGLKGQVSQSLVKVKAFGARLDRYLDDVESWEGQALTAKGVSELEAVLDKVGRVPSLVDA